MNPILDQLFWWSGALFWLALSGGVLFIAAWAIRDAGRAIIVAGSQLRFLRAVYRKLGKSRSTKDEIRAAFGLWWLAFAHSSTATLQGEHGRWEGVGEWWVYPEHNEGEGRT